MMTQEMSADNTTITVTCNATHLTSFAVLVDLSGTLNPGVIVTKFEDIKNFTLVSKQKHYGHIQYNYSELYFHEQYLSPIYVIIVFPFS